MNISGNLVTQSKDGQATGEVLLVHTPRERDANGSWRDVKGGNGDPLKVWYRLGSAADATVQALLKGLTHNDLILVQYGSLSVTETQKGDKTVKNRNLGGIEGVALLGRNKKNVKGLVVNGKVDGVDQVAAKDEVSALPAGVTPEMIAAAIAAMKATPASDNAPF